MAITIMRSVVSEAIVKITGTGIQTIDLDSLIADSQTVTGTPTVDIGSVHCTTRSAAILDQVNIVTITRNNVDILYLHANVEIDIPQVIFKEHNTSDIVVDMGTVNSTLILRLNKVAGYSVGPI